MEVFYTFKNFFKIRTEEDEMIEKMLNIMHKKLKEDLDYSNLLDSEVISPVSEAKLILKVFIFS